MRCSPADEELLERSSLVLGHQQHCRVELVGALAQQLAYRVAVHAAAGDFNLVWDLHQAPTAQQAQQSGMPAKVASLVL